MIDQLINGIALGSIYALLALGFTMVYGILFFINFPHGDLVMVAAYGMLVFSVFLKIPFWFALLFTILISALIGMGIEKIAYSQLRFVRRLAPLLSALGVSLVLSNGVMIIFSPSTQPFSVLIDFSIFGFFGLQPIIGFILVVSFVTMILLQLFLKRTKIGIATIAASQSLTTAELMGVNPNFVISLVFAIGASLGAIGGVLLAIRYGSISPTMGIALMLKAFAACVLGGIGNVYGAVLGAYVIAITEIFTIAFIGSSYRDMGGFLILIIMLLIKPSGLLGGRTEERV